MSDSEIYSEIKIRALTKINPPNPLLEERGFLKIVTVR